MNKSMLITGINSQLGQFLAKYMQENHPEIQIIGTVRFNYKVPIWIFDTTKVIFRLMELNNSRTAAKLVNKYKPTYFVNTAALAHVGNSWNNPADYLKQNSIAVTNQLEAIRLYSPLTRYFNMGTSEEFGYMGKDGLQNEDTILDPQNPYGASKVASRHIIKAYRKRYNLYAVQNWTWNFESELRGENYVTKKVTMGSARIKKALDNNLLFEPIELGNLDSSRSWQFCGDVADSIWRSLNQEKYNHKLRKDINYGFCGNIDKSRNWLTQNIKEYVTSSLECHTIRGLVEESFLSVGITGDWRANTPSMVDLPEKETFKLRNTNIDLVKINPLFYRPLDITFINGDSSLITKELGWKLTLSFKELVNRMVGWDLKQLA